MTELTTSRSPHYTCSSVRWLCAMAWRDSRGGRGVMLFYAVAVALGVMSLVAIRSVGNQLSAALAEQSKTLLGADLKVQSRRPFPDEFVTLLRSFNLPSSQQTRLSTMAYFPKSRDSRLVQLRALAGDFPYYGELETEPASAAQSFRGGGQAVVDDSVMTQFNLQVGDTIRLGQAELVIAGRIHKIPGENMSAGWLAPRVYVAHSDLAATELIRTGSRVRYEFFLKVSDSATLATVRDRLAPFYDRSGIREDTVEKRRERLGNNFANMLRFMNCVGFAGLMLGVIGVASGNYCYLRSKRKTAATLRCVGMMPRDVRRLYLIQSATIGLLGTILGVGLGVVAPFLFADIVATATPVQVSTQVSWSAALWGLGFGVVLSALISYMTLHAFTALSPMEALRSDYHWQPNRRALGTRVAVGLVAVMAAAVATQSSERQFGLAIGGGLIVTFGLLAATGIAITYVMRRWQPRRLPYVWRQGICNLYRPGNQTQVLVLALGLGTFLMATLHFTQSGLMTQLRRFEQPDRPNMVLVDVQPEQLSRVTTHLTAAKMPQLDVIPIVTMRLVAVNGVTLKARTRSDESDKKDKDQLPSWVRTWEYRATYRPELAAAESLLEGEWVTRSSADAELVPVSLESSIAKTLRVGVGDTLRFDVQGVPIETQIANIRKVDWYRMEPNFYLVFPAGVFEEAPQFQLVTTRAVSADASAAIQRTLVEHEPNVVVIDLRMALDVVDSLLARASTAVRGMTAFSLTIAILVMVAVLSATRHQRAREFGLLRTLGARRGQVILIALCEYAVLALVAAIVGTSLAAAAGWGLLHFAFEAVADLDLLAIPVIWGVVTLLTLTLGMYNTHRLLIEHDRAARGI